MRTLTWLLGGGTAALATYYWMRRTTGAAKTPDESAEPSAKSNVTPARAEPLPGRWVWPVGVWHDRKPEISDGYASKRRTKSGQVVPHGGVDVMYRRRPGDPWRTGTPNSTPRFVMPDHRPALAASDGVVSFAASTPRGWTVIIDHAPHKLATYYTHLSSLLVTSQQKVSAGTPLGVIGADPLDEHIMHLHFETWRGGAADRFDPQALMLASWEYLRDPGDQPGVFVARNARGWDRRSLHVRSCSRPHHHGVELAPYPFAERTSHE